MNGFKDHDTDENLSVSREYFIRADELQKIRRFHDNFVPVRMPLFDLISDDSIATASGIYAFVSRGRKWGHLYLGMSVGRLIRRVNEQRHLRRWASEVLLFPLQGLDRDTLEVLEKRLLRICAKQLTWVEMDNQRDLSAPTPDHFTKRGVDVDLEKLIATIFDWVTGSLGPSMGRPKKLHPTHILGTPNGDVHGIAAQRGGWTYLLPGSRISSRYPNYRSIAQDPIALERLEAFYRLGLIAWRPKRGSRPAGFVFTEPVPVRNIRSAARILYVGETVTEAWAPTKPKLEG